MTQATEPSLPGTPVTRTFAMSDVVRQFRELAQESATGSELIYDTLIIGGGAAGAGVLRDIASRGNASAVLVDRGPFGGQTSSKTGKAIHPGIRYLRMSFHRLLLALRLRKDPKIQQSFSQNLRAAWSDLKLVWYGTRERKILLETCGDTVEEIPNIVFVFKESPEKKWAVFLGIGLYDFFTTLWAWSGLRRRFSRIELFSNADSLHKKLPHLDSPGVLGGVQYWDGKASNDKILVLKAIRDAYYRGSVSHPIRALSFVEIENYEWTPQDPNGCFHVTLVRRFSDDELPQKVIVKAHTLVNAAGPWVDQARNRTAGPDDKVTVAYSRGTHLEATNRFIHESLSENPQFRIGLVPLNVERQHYLRPFYHNGLWYVQCTTTDRSHSDPDHIVPMEDEIEELLHSYNELVDEKWRIGRRDIFNVFCGIRPLAMNEGGKIGVKDLSRMFRISRQQRGDGAIYDMLNIKLTEFRWAGREVVSLVAKDLRRKGVKTLGPSVTHRLSLLAVAGEERFAINRVDYPRGDHEFLRQKVRHYVNYQMVYSLEDYLLNSGAIRDAVVFDDAGQCELDREALVLLLDEMATLLGWDPQRRLQEWERFETVYTRNMAYCDLRDRLARHDPDLGASVFASMSQRNK